MVSFLCLTLHRTKRNKLLNNMKIDYINQKIRRLERSEERKLLIKDFYANINSDNFNVEAQKNNLYKRELLKMQRKIKSIKL